MSQLVSKKPRATSRKQVRVFLAEQHSETLANLQGIYSEALGRPVSKTVIVRRALALLHGHLEATRKGNIEGWCSPELAELMKAA